MGGEPARRRAAPEVRRVGPLRGGQLTRLVSDGMPGASIIRLLKDRRNSQLRRVSNETCGPSGLPPWHPQHRRRHQGGLELLEASLLDCRPSELGLQAAQGGKWCSQVRKALDKFAVIIGEDDKAPHVGVVAKVTY